MEIIPKRDARHVPIALRLVLSLVVVILCAVIGTIGASIFSDYLQVTQDQSAIGSFIAQFSLDRAFLSALVTAAVTHLLHTFYGAFRRM